ncbi:MAG: DUF2993 domain-containing protein [Oscillatoriales cyanobacterium SM2_3_0]|nr:DUF2993 domain-containing protein [Oscillatoriales cyanobacterium SM2_3_0]
MDFDQSQGNQWVSRILSQAIQFWLRSRVDQIQDLRVNLSGSNRAILSGSLPKASVFATKAAYQGIHLSQIEAIGSNIRLNLKQVLRGQPLQLVERFPIDCTLYLSPEDLSASSKAPILIQGLQDIWPALIQDWIQTLNPALNPALNLLSLTVTANSRVPDQVHPLKTARLQLIDVKLTTSQIILDALLSFPEQSGLPIPSLIPLSLVTHLEVVTPQLLQLTHLQIQAPLLIPETTLEQFQIDLGSDVKIQQLYFSPAGIFLQGQIWVNP